MVSRRSPLTGVQQAGVKIALTLEALANAGKPVKVEGGEGVIVDHDVVGKAPSLRIRYKVRVRRVGLVWRGAESVLFG